MNLEEQCLTIRRSIRYDGSRAQNIIGPTKRKGKVVDFGDTLAEILHNAQKEQLKTRYSTENFATKTTAEVKTKTEFYYRFYHLDGTEVFPEDYKEISFVCLRLDGDLELPSDQNCLQEDCSETGWFEGFHFHQLQHLLNNLLLMEQHQRCTGTVRTLRCQYHHECLCTLQENDVNLQGYLIKWQATTK